MSIKLGLIVIAGIVLNHLFATGHFWCGMAFAASALLFFGPHNFTFALLELMVQYAVGQMLLWTAAIRAFHRRNKVRIPDVLFPVFVAQKSFCYQ